MERFAREQAPERAERTDTLVWGKNAVTELLKSGGAVDTVYLTDTMPQAVAGYYTALAKESGAVVKRVPGNKLQKMCGTPDHQGVAARAAEVEYAALDDLFRAAEARGEQPFLVLCDGVEDPHNLGAIVPAPGRPHGCPLPGCPIWRRRSARSRSIISLSTVLTSAVPRWQKRTSPARWRWSWAVRAAAPVR